MSLIWNKIKKNLYVNIIITDKQNIFISYLFI